MNRYHLGITIAIALFGLMMLAGTTEAQEIGSTGTPVLTLDPIPAAIVGERPVTVAHLTTPTNQPIRGQELSLVIDGSLAKRATTDANGTAVFEIGSRLPVGMHDLSVTYEGNPNAGLAPTSATSQIQINPGTLDVQTIPAMPNVEMSLVLVSRAGGHPVPDAREMRATSNSAGLVQFPITRDGIYRVTVILPWASPYPEVNAEFSRWGDNEFEPFRDVDFKPGKVYFVGFEVHHLVSLEFTNLQSEPVDPADIESVKLISSMGERITLTTVEPFWVKSVRVTMGRGNLEAVQLHYSIEEVMVDGQNVVNRAQYRFIPSENQSTVVQLLYYSMSFTSLDAIFAFPMGDSIEVISPNGTIRNVPLDSSGQAFLPLLPRGEYQVRVHGGGYSPIMPVALSRDQAVNLKVISMYDVIFVAGLGGSVAVSLLLVGRWRTLRTRWWFAKRARQRLQSS